MWAANVVQVWTALLKFRQYFGQIHYSRLFDIGSPLVRQFPQFVSVSCVHCNDEYFANLSRSVGEKFGSPVCSAFRNWFFSFPYTKAWLICIRLTVTMILSHFTAHLSFCSRYKHCSGFHRQLMEPNYFFVVFVH